MDLGMRYNNTNPVSLGYTLVGKVSICFTVKQMPF